MSISATSVAGVLGIFGGFVAVAFATYLQFNDEYVCPPKYVVAFYLLGVGLLLININPSAFMVGEIGEWLPVAGNLLIVLCEFLGFRHVVAEIRRRQTAGVTRVTSHD